MHEHRHHEKKERNYWTSHKKWIYIWIAIKHFTLPSKVYDLAHGKQEMHSKDRPIMHDLKMYDVIHHTKGYHGAE